MSSPPATRGNNIACQQRRKTSLGDHKSKSPCYQHCREVQIPLDHQRLQTPTLHYEEYTSPDYKYQFTSKTYYKW
ncbi:hypothetical protein GSI_09122 [Ganoderma sinense ZZ0214-1]|uniref:Uncharacterized protein n=1 Tax=Ganoderma sinense ZZ0214-1 TaxID=1077348 RepID=A0A2G8S5Q9_9APHY|nr:hypothetical protein GSI_09122 [Ganoderma sinense ZZ0214-1]